MLMYVLIVFSIILTSTTNSFNGKFQYVIETGSEVYVEGSSNINKFTCYCKCKKELSSEIYSVQIQQKESSFFFDGAHLNLRAESLDCENKRMNLDMYETLKVDQFPYFNIKLVEVLQRESSLDSQNTWVPYNAWIEVTIGGVTKNKLLGVNARSLGSGRYQFVSTAHLALSDFNLEQPVALMGLIKVKNEIRIYFDIVVQTR